jgi:choline kinase
MKAIILSAGQGRRLMPLTANRPKCLIPLSGRPLLEWQLRNLAAAGIDEAVIVTGFGVDQVEAALMTMQLGDISVSTLHNPFFALADNLGSCWAARDEMEGDVLILNGDTLFDSEIASRLANHQPTAPITVTIDRKHVYDSDDMKVQVDGDRLVAIAKTLEPDAVDGESIGFLRLTAAGSALFRDAVEKAMRRPEGLKQWYLSVIDQLAKSQGQVGVMSIEGLPWGEMDFPADVKRNERITANWSRPGEFNRAAEAG